MSVSDTHTLVRVFEHLFAFTTCHSFSLHTAPPSITINHEGPVVKEGESFTLKSSVQGWPTPHIQVYNDYWINTVLCV